MSMGVPDYWIKLIEDKKDEEWHVGDMFYELTNKRPEEHTISYAESHDQAMVGDKNHLFPFGRQGYLYFDECFRP